MSIYISDNPVLDAERYEYDGQRAYERYIAGNVSCCYCGNPIATDECLCLDITRKDESCICEDCINQVKRALKEKSDAYDIFKTIIESFKTIDTPHEEE